MKEEWKPIRDYPHLLISNTGKVYTNVYKREINQYKSNRGYMVVCLCKDKKINHFATHRLVAEAFLPNPDNLPTVDHINGDKTDNKVENLQWLSYSDNILKYRKENNHSTKPKAVVCIDSGNIYKSVNEASRCLSIPVATISAICKGEYDHYKGLHFKYWEEV